MYDNLLHSVLAITWLDSFNVIAFLYGTGMLEYQRAIDFLNTCTCC